MEGEKSGLSDLVSVGHTIYDVMLKNFGHIFYWCLLYSISISLHPLYA